MLTIYSSLVVALLLASPLPAAAQVSYPECPASSSWSFNSLGQSPCAVAAYLQASCDGDDEIQSLATGHAYKGPSEDTVNSTKRCMCNTVAYSLTSACVACQFESAVSYGEAVWLSWKKWSVNCSTVDPPSTFSKTIPYGTRVPAWAFLDVTKNGTWDPDLSYQVGDSPEAVAGQSRLPTPISKHNGHHINKTAAIVGGVFGGIALIVLTIVLIIWRQRIKRHKATRAAAAVILAAVPLQEKESKRNRGDPPPDVVSSAI